MTGCVTTYKAGAPKGAVNVIAHRGASAYAPENTLAAFELAIEQGADWFELDCYLSKDGKLVISHDRDVERTTDGTGYVQDLTLAELKALDAGSWFSPEFAGERMPTLGEALDLAKGRIGVYIEIKNSDDDKKLLNDIIQLADSGDRRFSRAQRREMTRLIEASGSHNLELTREVIAQVRERDMKHQVVIQSFTPIACAVALEEAPELRTEFLGGEDKDDPGRWPLYLRWGHLIDAAGFNTSHESMSPERLAEFHAEGRSVAVWTVDDPADMRRFAAWGVDSIITNKPDVCVNELRAMGKRGPSR
ncbi:MAG TPA: glycerophosphodiester phosphodiesterase family protein [Candidatus Hydrogenedentes bacterium]|nr:glycerophosphodiester phosphodiesterase family protein [Candidatus Hydrogenedentota bacterium]HPG68299.1 glycerophosphodiester phosphodiesterase family protein [Candidatus Hydrogenedentota bacterium]